MIADVTELLNFTEHNYANDNILLEEFVTAATLRHSFFATDDER